MAKEGIQVMKQVGKVVEKNVLTMKEKVLDSYTKPPPTKADYKYPDRPDLFRVGFVELRDVRIFTKEMISRGSGGSNSHVNSGYPHGAEKHSDESTNDVTTSIKNGGGTTAPTTTATNSTSSVVVAAASTSSSFDIELKPLSSHSQSKPRLTLGVNGWSKPMYVKEVRLYPAELCPPSYSLATILKEKEKEKESSSSSTPNQLQIVDTAALIGLPIEQVSNIITTKVLTEVAKTNTGQLLTNAFTEVFAWFDVDEA